MNTALKIILVIACISLAFLIGAIVAEIWIDSVYVFKIGATSFLFLVVSLATGIVISEAKGK